MDCAEIPLDRDYSTWRKGRWTSDEDDLLRLSIEKNGEKHWRLVAASVPGRSPIQCLHRWSKILRPGLIKGPWSAEEDTKLREWVTLQGPKRWSACAQRIAGRNGKQCRERWCNTLCPDIKKGEWTSEEDKVIFGMYASVGSKWTLIAKYLQGRTENSIKNRFYSAVRRNLLPKVDDEWERRDCEDVDYMIEDRTDASSAASSPQADTDLIAKWVNHS